MRVLSYIFMCVYNVLLFARKTGSGRLIRAEITKSLGNEIAGPSKQSIARLSRITPCQQDAQQRASQWTLRILLKQRSIW